VTAIPAEGLARGVGGITELQGLIDAHRAADSAFCDAIDRDPAFYSNRRSVRAERERLAADAAKAAAFMALCSYLCRTFEEARIKARYLLTKAPVKDRWDDDPKALLESFVEENAT
jgi:hypothetical protein